MEEWRIRDRLISIALDIVTSNDALVGGLRWEIPCEDNLLHQRCATHIINLIVKAGSETYDPCIAKIRDAIAWVNSSNPRVDELKIRFLLNGLNVRTFHLDNRIRWNSVHLMLKNFFSPSYYEVIVQFVNHTSNSYITEDDIAMAKVFLWVLSPFLWWNLYIICCVYTYFVFSNS